MKSNNAESYPGLAQDVICDAFACLAKATQELKLPVGGLGEIRLNICDKCQSKFIFQNNSAQIIPIKKQYSGSTVGSPDQSIHQHQNDTHGSASE